MTADFKSLEVMVAARTSTLTSTQRSVLNAMALRAGKQGACWAAVGTIAGDCGFSSERTVQGAIKELVRLAILLPDDDEQNTGSTRVYHFNITAIPQRQLALPTLTPAAGAPPQDVRGTPAAGAPTPAAGAPNPSMDPSDRSDLPTPNPRPCGPGAELGDLTLLTDKQEAIGAIATRILERKAEAGEPTDRLIEAWEDGEADAIDAMTLTLRGVRVVQIDGTARRHRPQGSPNAVRKRDVETALREAARRWRSRPPDTGPPRSTGVPNPYDPDEDDPADDPLPPGLPNGPPRASPPIPPLD